MGFLVVRPEFVFSEKQRGKTLYLVDVRSPAEFGAVHAEGAILHPLDTLKPRQLAEQLGLSSAAPAALLCASGNRAKKAAEMFHGAGIPHCLVVEGGTRAWEAAGLPTIKGKGMISLERQVRIGAGSLVIAGVLLGHFIHPGWYGLSGVVGCGLIFAGITDWCGMGLLLAKMPWNRKHTTSCQI